MVAGVGLEGGGSRSEGSVVGIVSRGANYRRGRWTDVWGFVAGATQVKWNRREPHVIASAHDSRVLIWDDRMGATPMTTINGHDAKICSLPSIPLPQYDV